MARPGADPGRAQCGRRDTGEKEGRKETQWEGRGRAWNCIYFGLVGSGEVPSSHTGSFLPQNHQALKTKKSPTQPKPNQKCVCGAPAMFWVFSPILPYGDKGPVFPLDPSPGPGQLTFPFSTPAVSNLFPLFRPPPTLLPTEK